MFCIRIARSRRFRLVVLTFPTWAVVEPKSLVGGSWRGELLAVLFGAFYEHCLDTMERSRFRGERKSGESRIDRPGAAS